MFLPPPKGESINTKTQVKTGRGCFDPDLYTKFLTD
jgi:hypothetical protein